VSQRVNKETMQYW